MLALSENAVEAVARALYGEDEYDASPPADQVRDAYRKRARALLRLAADAVEQTHEEQGQK